jgi:thiamine biosynthesis protein ThiS
VISVNGEERAWRAGMTVADLLKDIDNSRHCSVVRINNKHVSSPNFEKALIPDNAEVFLLPMIAGG